MNETLIFLTMVHLAFSTYIPVSFQLKNSFLISYEAFEITYIPSTSSHFTLNLIEF